MAEPFASRAVGPTRLEVVEADITTLRLDAIVDAANASLAGGGGVDGAIHRAAGPELRAACRAIGGRPTGDARITPGVRLPARFVVHAVGPVRQGGGRGEDRDLASRYARAVALSAEAGARSLACPAIATGIDGIPAERAAPIAIRAVLDAPALGRLASVAFCCFGARSARLHAEALGQGEATVRG